MRCVFNFVFHVLGLNSVLIFWHNKIERSWYLHDMTVMQIIADRNRMTSLIWTSAKAGPQVFTSSSTGQNKQSPGSQSLCLQHREFSWTNMIRGLMWKLSFSQIIKENSYLRSSTFCPRTNWWGKAAGTIIYIWNVYVTGLCRYRFLFYGLTDQWGIFIFSPYNSHERFSDMTTKQHIYSFLVSLPLFQCSHLSAKRCLPSLNKV